jgi:flagellar basal-body rod protein FlgC
MGFSSSFEVSAQGMDVERRRLEVAAYNLANANTTRTADGSPFHRKILVARAAEGGVTVGGVVDDPRPPRREYAPGHPDAGPDGWVTLPNVEPVEEMVDVMGAARAYEANAAAFSAAREMAMRALDMMR